jgi:hypothetical protein
MNCVANCLLKPAVDSFPIEIESHWSCNRKGNNRTVTAMKIAVGACVTVSFDIQLSKERKFVEGYLLVLMATDVFERCVYGERM